MKKTVMFWKDKQAMFILTICINYQQKATTVINMGKFRNMSLLKTTIDTWLMWTNETEWLTIQSAREYGSGRKKTNYFSSLGLNTYIIVSYGTKQTTKDFGSKFIRRQSCPQFTPRGRPKLEAHTEPWAAANSCLRCCVCLATTKEDYRTSELKLQSQAMYSPTFSYLP